MPWFRPLESPLTRPVRLGVMVSGGGTTLQNFIDQISEGVLAAEVTLVISSQAQCGGVERAQRAGIPVQVVERGGHPSAEEFSTALFDLLRNAEVDLVVMAGFLCLIHVPDDFHCRVMNIHPSLIPAFCGHGYYGHKVHEAAIERGVRVSGCTVHFADNEYDHGPIIAQRTVDVPDNETPDGLAARVFEVEKQAYPQAVRWFADGRMSVSGRRVRVH